MLGSGAKRPRKFPCFRRRIGGHWAASIARRPLPPMHHSEYQQALQRYAHLREAACRAAHTEALRNGGIGAPFWFSAINSSALSAWRSTWLRSQAFGYGGWNWDRLVRPVWRRPTGFHLAIWSGRHLCGLAVGRASKRRPCGERHTLSVHFLEANPDPRHPLKGHVAGLALACADSYGAALGAQTLRLVNPLPGVIRLYMEMGFSVAGSSGGALYLKRRIEE